MHEGARDCSARLSVALCAIMPTARLCIAIAVRCRTCEWLDASTEQRICNVIRNEARIHTVCSRVHYNGSGRGLRSAVDLAFCDQPGSALTGFLRYVTSSQVTSSQVVARYGEGRRGPAHSLAAAVQRHERAAPAIGKRQPCSACAAFCKCLTSWLYL